jgi:subtilase family serine protease
VTATIYVNNTGRASANNVTVDLYAGNAQSGGFYIGSTTTTVPMGGFAQTTFTWKPSQIGTYPIYVYVNSNHNVQEYDYNNNSAFKSLTVTISIDGSDLVVGGLKYPTLTITGPNAFNWAYNVVVMNDGVLTITNTAFSEVQSSSYALRIIVMDDATLRLVSGSTLSSNLHLDLYLMDNANLTVIGSTISPAIHIRADDSSSVYIASSQVGADLVAPETSYATVVAQDTNFGQAWSSFGGHAQAHVTNISIAALNPKDSAVINHYRWVKVVALDGTGERLPGADVSVFHPVNGDHIEGVTGTDGSTSFRVLTDVRTAGMTVYQGFVGSYFANASYTYGGQTYYALYTMNVGVTGYTEPVTRVMMAPVMISISGALPDLDPPLTLSTTTPAHYEQVTVTTEVSNIGVVAARNVQVYFNDTGVPFYTTEVPYIGPGETLIVTCTWTASALGQRNISVAIDPFNRISEFDNTNNGNYTVVFVHGIPDLYVQSSDVTINPSLPNRGQSATISATIRNGGDVSASNVRVSFYSTDPSGNIRTLLSDTTIGYIDVNEYGVAQMTWTPSLPGTYTLVVIVDRLDTIDEISEVNNAYTFEQRVLDYADLRVNYILFDPASPVGVNDVVDIEAAIKNVGDIAATNVMVYFYLGPSSSGALIDTEVISTIASGQTQTAIGHWTANITEGLGSETKQITVVVNPNIEGRISEISYDNNEATQSLMVNDLRADLLFDDSMTIERSGVPIIHASQGETVNISVIAINTGNTAANSVKFHFYAVDDLSNQALITTVTKDVGAGMQVEVNATWQIDRGLGTYTILVSANRDGLIEESDITNNFISMEFEVDAPNVKVELNPLDGNDYSPGSTIYVTGRVTNSNTSEAIPGVTVVAYLSKNGVREGQMFNSTTNSAGYYSIPVYVPDGFRGDYQVHSSVTIGDKTTSTFKNVSIKQVAEGGIPWYLYLVILGVIAAAIIFFSVWLYKYGLGRWWNAGSAEPSSPRHPSAVPSAAWSSRSVPAKCSECGAWIPSNSTACPECGVKFINDAIEEEENAYLSKMREQYEAYVETFRPEAKAALGKKYSTPSSRIGGGSSPHSSASRAG